tara:strand:+ start:1379 stop:1690 length:312 start_codon:yes stop_codon:yes gene_type:complete
MKILNLVVRVLGSQAISRIIPTIIKLRKLYEEFFISDNINKISNSFILSAKGCVLKLDNLKVILEKLEMTDVVNNSNQLQSLLIEAVPEFISQSENIDLLFGE